jgi:hypothetical protein
MTCSRVAWKPTAVVCDFRAKLYMRHPAADKPMLFGKKEELIEGSTNDEQSLQQ